MQKQMTVSQWETFYRDPLNFASIFRDLTSLEEQADRFTISTSQRNQLEAIETVVNEKFGH